MKIWIVAVLASLVVGALAEDIKLANGQIVRGDISRVEPDGLMVLTDSGVEKISFLALPEETQKRYGFDFKKAEEYRKAQVGARQQTLQQQAAAIRAQAARAEALQKSQPTAEETEQRIKVEASAFFARATVIQGTSQGVRVKLVTQTGRAAATMLNQDTRATVSLGEGFIHGLRGAEGEAWEGKLYSAGYFTYSATLGAERTVRGFATSVDEAMKHGGDGRVIASGTSIPGTTARPGAPGKLRGGTLLDPK